MLNTIIHFLIGLSFLWPSSQGIACTLFGAIGNAVEGGGVLIGKTRDQSQDLEQVFIEVIPKGRFRYKGISNRGKAVVTSGINEKGLVLVSASASNIEREKGKNTSVGAILSKASSVEGIIEIFERGEIQGPIHFLAGDTHQIALFEVMDRNRKEFLVKEDGVLYHTNHFILKGMENLNPKKGLSSSARLDRIKGLLEKGPFTRDGFIGFTKGHIDSPGNHSICRHFEAGVRSSKQTVSAAVYYLPKGASPEFWVSLGQPCQSIFKRH